MTSVSRKNLSIELGRLQKLKGVLTNSGNKERSHSFIMHLYTILKQGFRGQDVTYKYQLSSFGETKPLAIIDRCLYRLMPAFVLRRIIKSGKSFELPVPISENHASFKACHWLLKATLKNNKSALTIPYLLTQEICATLHNEGAALDYLKAYIEIALDQRPFMRYIRKKRKVISRSKRTYAGARLRKIYRKQQSLAFKHRNRFRRGHQRINLHSTRRQALIQKKRQKSLKRKNFKFNFKKYKRKFSK